MASKWSKSTSIFFKKIKRKISCAFRENKTKPLEFKSDQAYRSKYQLKQHKEVKSFTIGIHTVSKIQVISYKQTTESLQQTTRKLNRDGGRRDGTAYQDRLDSPTNPNKL